MVNHPNRRKPVRSLSDAALAMLLNRIENHASDALPLTETQFAALAARTDLITLTDAGRWRQTEAGRDFARANDPRLAELPVDANRIWCLIRKLMGIDDDEAVNACATVGLDVSKSRINGWRKHPADRKHAKMTLDELEQVLLGMIKLEMPRG